MTRRRRRLKRRREEEADDLEGLKRRNHHLYI
jgi:hypothetical protein